MENPEYYRERAGKMRELANTSCDPTMKLHLQAVAESWDNLALRAEKYAKAINEFEQLREIWNVK